jgi:seryl-tRNA synthetase
MLTARYIREHPDLIIRKLKIKNFDAGDLVKKIIELDDLRKKTQAQQDQKLSTMNATSKEIGILFRDGKQEEAEKAKNKTAVLKDEIKELSQAMQTIEKKLFELLVQVPNIPHESVAPGTGEEDNVEVRSGGTPPVLDETAKTHWELGKTSGILDFDLGNKITGSGFPLFKEKGAKLQRALARFFLDRAVEAGYTEILPPLMVNEDSAFGTGQLPDKEGQMYHITSDNLYLIPTSEVPVTNIYRDQILNSSELPVKMTSYTPCFRREAGSYGKDVRGLNRVHQFDKVEIVQIQHPLRSYQSLDEMVAHVEALLVDLELPYRIMRLCGGDLSFTSALTYDFEVFAAAQKKWLEVSSVSNFESYQAHRLKLRFREPGDKKTQWVHTLNGSALALPRVVAALLENNQTRDGITMPEVLIPYTGFDSI